MEGMYKDGSYESMNPTWHAEDSPWKAEQIRKLLVKNNIVPETICEVGCGAGGILIKLQEAFPRAQLCGYEISPQAFSLCGDKGNESLHFYLGDLLQKEDAFFDVVLAADVFEHVEDYMGFLKRLKNKGRLKIFHIPLDLSVQTVFRASPILEGRRSVGHIHYFFKGTAIATLEDCGYKIIDCQYTAKSLELPNPTVGERVLRLPRRVLFALSPDVTVRILGGYSLLVLAE